MDQKKEIYIFLLFLDFFFCSSILSSFFFLFFFCFSFFFFFSFSLFLYFFLLFLVVFFCVFPLVFLCFFFVFFFCFFFRSFPLYFVFLCSFSFFSLSLSHLVLSKLRTVSKSNSKKRIKTPKLKNKIILTIREMNKRRCQQCFRTGTTILDLSSLSFTTESKMRETATKTFPLLNKTSKHKTK